MSGQQSVDDALEELLNLKVMIGAAFLFGPALLLAMSSTATRWCLDQGVLVPAEKSAVQIPYVTPHAGLDVARLVIFGLVLLAVGLAMYRWSVATRRRRARQALRDMSS